MSPCFPCFPIITFATAESNRRYGPEDLKIAQDVVYRASVAIDNAKLYSELQQADRRKDEFLAMLAHELRNPLAPIRSGLDLLRIKGDDPATTHWVHETMSQQVTHMVRLVDDLMDVSRIMRGKVQLRPEPVEISTIVTRAVEVARPLIDSKQHDLSVELPPMPIEIQADPIRLTQVVANLLNNAAKYTDKGGRIRLSVAFANDQLVLRVSDTGIGLTPDMQQHVFDLFTQADQSPERTQGGLGIGLTLVRSLVEMHGGRVEVSSAGPGRGSEFTVRLPAKLHRRDEASPPTIAEPSGPVPLRVLVVDDNKAAATMVSRLLQAKGQTVEIAYDGPAALEAARQFHPDVVLLDIGLPGISGYEVARELRRQPNGNRLLLVAVTGYGQQEDRQRSQEAGFDVHLVKPLSLDELQRVIGTMKE
ncbi:MAG: response regulator [Planctomycetes bacterium]|nr:response regulator [Planctomycetota bacterium]